MSEVERLALDYMPVILFLGIGLAMSLLFIVGNAILAPSNPDPEKNSAYECGFNAFDDARMKFDVRNWLYLRVASRRPRVALGVLRICPGNSNHTH